MKDIYRSAYVYVGELLAGIVKETEDGYLFQYEENYLKMENATPVSLTLPIQTGEYHSETSLPFFDGLIPEGWLLNIVSKNWKISQNDRFGLLLVACKDPIGNVRIEEVTK